MKNAWVILAFAALLPATARGQSIEQCKDSANMLAAMINNNNDFVTLIQAMTAGEEIALSTKYAHCLENFPTALTPEQFSRLDRMVYKLDADVMARMFQFIERRHLTDTFNGEQEAQKKAGTK